jgi:hypothetical protein
MSIEAELGTLIRRLNPYTAGKPGTMRFKSGNLDGAAIDAAKRLDECDLSHIQLEVEGVQIKSSNYAAQWIFKGQAQNIVKAIRIKYQYPVDGDNGKILATDYLLIGYEGSPGS